MQANGSRAVSTRACTECARSRERCTKSSPCQRCLTKGLRCAYPQARGGIRTQESRYNPGSVSGVSVEPPPGPPVDASGTMGNISRLDRQHGSFIGSEPTDGHNAYIPYQQMVPFEMSEYPQGQMLQPTMDFPMNWLPPDNSIAIDYDNIVGLGIGSLDFFSLPNTSADVTSIPNNVQQESLGAGSAAAQLPVIAAAHSDTHIYSAGEPGTVWNNVSPGTVESYLSSESPRSAAHTVSPSDAPGGLYATSINGARMPCTIRARRASRLIPGATPIRPLNRLRSDNLYNLNRGMAFPDINHVFVDDATNAANGSTYVTPLLPSTVYENILQSFGRLCLNDSASFPLYTSSTFPELPSLNMCIRLYFENFDAVMPILHDQVTQISGHWILALAVSAIGCQYAEADEYAQMVEPMHEFLRRAIVVEINNESLETIGQDRHRIAFAQAMTLSQVGMLYSGSPRLLHFAKAQHSAMVELARALVSSMTANEAVSAVIQEYADQDSQDLAWRDMMIGECKRRISYSIWVRYVGIPSKITVVTHTYQLLDCMAIYHFRQQLFVPPDMMAMPLPNDKLWQSKSAADWLIQPRSSQGKRFL